MALSGIAAPARVIAALFNTLVAARAHAQSAGSLWTIAQLISARRPRPPRARDDVVEPTRERRRGLAQSWKAAHKRAGEILFAEDPIGINYETNTREYDLEVGTILPRLRTCNSVAEIRAVLHEEFGHWFGAEMVGPPEKYQRIAEQFWTEVMPGLKG